jgi:hypothetical protein
MSKNEEKPEIEEPEEPTEEPEKIEETEKPLTRKDIEEIFNRSIEKRFPRKPAKTRADKPPKPEAEETKDCPRCKRPLIEATYKGESGYYCKECGKFYAV